MAVYFIFVGVGLAADAAAVLWASYREKIVSLSTVDMVAPFTLSIMATLLVLFGSVGIVRNLSLRSRLWLALSCGAFFLAVPLLMSAAGAGMNVHGWTFYMVWPTMQSLFVMLVSLLSVLISAIRKRLPVDAERVERNSG